MLVIKNAKIYTSAGMVYEKGDIAIENGKIVDIGESLSCEQAEVLDCKGLVVIPGIVDAHSHIEVLAWYDRSDLMRWLKMQLLRLRLYIQ